MALYHFVFLSDLSHAIYFARAHITKIDISDVKNDKFKTKKFGSQVLIRKSVSSLDHIG